MKNIHKCLIICFLISSFTIHAQNPGFGKEQRGNPNPFRVFYFGYNLNNPGIMMGPEYDFLWTKTDKITCATGMKYIDKRLLFCPQFGFFTNLDNSFSLFANIEIDYQIVYDRGWIFEMFVSPGYALGFGDGTTPIRDEEIETIFEDARGSFMSQIGFGTGYNFHKLQKADMSINLRVLSASAAISESFFLPAFQLGITYNL